MADILILNASIITVDRERRVISNGGIAIEGDKILDVGQSERIKASYSADKVIDNRHLIAMPGMVNCHNHIFQDLMRGLGDDYALYDWIRLMLRPMGQNLSLEDVYYSCLLGCVEMLKTGTTFVVNHHHQNTSEEANDLLVKAMRETGMKGYIARSMREDTASSSKFGMAGVPFQYSPEEELRLTEKLIQKWNNSTNGDVNFCPGPGSLQSCGEFLYQGSKKLAEKYNTPIHSHVAETQGQLKLTQEVYGKNEVEWLDSIDVLSPRFQAVHGVWLEPKDVELMGKTRANHIHCPVSNMYLASGVAPIPDLMKVGVNIALGTDGPASNNSQDMFGVLKAACLLHKVTTLNPTIITSERVLEMATLGGAKACGKESEIGAVEVGKKADIVLVNSKKPHIAPVHRAVSSIVYNANGNDVDTVMVNGRIVVEDGSIKTIDEASVIEKAIEVAEGLVGRSEVEHLRSRPWK